MRIGYPCLNYSLDCRGNKRFILKSYSAARLAETVAGNLDCLRQMLAFNRDHGLLYFRISSDLVPFASHPVCTFDWRTRFAREFAALGACARTAKMRLAMHPDQFVLLNALDERIVARSIAELQYHADVLDLMRMPATAKIQIHVGGVYGDKAAAMTRFATVYATLPAGIRRRLVIENDERLFGVEDCLRLHERTGIPVLCDVFHHACYGGGMTVAEALRAAARTWRKTDGILLIDYSEQAAGARTGAHAATLTDAAFRAFLRASRGIDGDVLLEIKDKEQSALRALRLAARDPRLVTGGARRAADSTRRAGTSPA